MGGGPNYTRMYVPMLFLIIQLQMVCLARNRVLRAHKRWYVTFSLYLYSRWTRSKPCSLTYQRPLFATISSAAEVLKLHVIEFFSKGISLPYVFICADHCSPLLISLVRRRHNIHHLLRLTVLSQHLLHCLLVRTPVLPHLYLLALYLAIIWKIVSMPIPPMKPRLFVHLGPLMPKIVLQVYRNAKPR